MVRYLSGVQFKHILYEKDLSTRENTYMIFFFFFFGRNISYMTIQKKKDYIMYASLHTYTHKHTWLIYI